MYRERYRHIYIYIEREREAPPGAAGPVARLE